MGSLFSYRLYSVQLGFFWWVSPCVWANRRTRSNGGSVYGGKREHGQYFTNRGVDAALCDSRVPFRKILPELKRVSFHSKVTTIRVTCWTPWPINQHKWSLPWLCTIKKRSHFTMSHFVASRVYWTIIPRFTVSWSQLAYSKPVKWCLCVESWYAETRRTAFGAEAQEDKTRTLTLSGHVPIVGMISPRQTRPVKLPHKRDTNENGTSPNRFNPRLHIRRRA